MILTSKFNDAELANAKGALSQYKKTAMEEIAQLKVTQTELQTMMDSLTVTNKVLDKQVMEYKRLSREASEGRTVAESLVRGSELRVAEFETVIVQLRKTISELRAQEELLTVQLNEALEKMSAVQYSKNGLESLLAQVKTDLALTVQQRDEERAKVKTSSTETAKHIERLEGEIKSNTIKLSQVNDENSNDVRKANKELNQVRDLLMNAEATIADLEAKLDAKTAQLNDHFITIKVHF